MKTHIYSCVHGSNGLSLEVVGETEAERELLKAMWKHGRLVVTHHGYVIEAFRQVPETETHERSER